MTKPSVYLTETHPKTVIIGVAAPYNTIANIDSYFEEFRNLVTSNRITYDEELYVTLRAIDPAYFFTKGKMAEIKQLCDDNQIEEVIISEPLTAQQERNIADMLHCKVFDRTQLILEIFEKGAHSAEGKAQVAIAMFQHQKSRMAGKGIHLSQQAGMRGFRGGFGETAKEKERRHIEKNILQLEKQLAQLRKVRQTQRKKRISAGIKNICLIGYTNAGKSTILNALTKSNVLAEDILFATLDTTTRALFIDGEKIGVISDTVGFIQLLPHHLIEAFKSTLSELAYADLLLHVVDIADQNWESHVQVVHEILEELHVDKKTLYVFNKADKLGLIPHEESIIRKYQPHVIVSATAPDGLLPLIEFIKSWQYTT